MRNFVLGFLCGIAVLVTVGLTVNLLWDKLIENTADQQLSDVRRSQVVEIVARVQNALTKGEFSAVGAEEIHRYPTQLTPLPPAAELNQYFVFFKQSADSAVKRNEAPILVIAEKRGHYKTKHGGWVGFAQPGQVRWLGDHQLQALSSNLPNLSVGTPIQ
jgi:hypothetical protein